MKGRIRSRERCPICNGALIHREERRGCFCDNHPDIRATSFIVWFPGDIYQRHQSYEAACQALNYLRYEKGTRNESFDPEDYKSTRPNSFPVLAPIYLAQKKVRALRKIKAIINRAAEYKPFKEKKNIREITNREINEFLYSLVKKDGREISEKTRSNYCIQLINFWKWSVSFGAITQAEMPTFPDIEFELAYRKITTWENQEKVLDKVKEMTFSKNPKILLGIDMLCTYTKLRPDDLRRIKEEHFNQRTGYLTIPRPTKKKKKPNKILLHPDHQEEWMRIKVMYPALPSTPFFRHSVTITNAKQGALIGKNYLYRIWVRAAKEIGLEGVSLYAGTKHTTATETAELLGEEMAEKASGLTNKAFMRYCLAEDRDVIEVVTEIMKEKKGKVLSFKKAKAYNE